jgi:hypothetical protein
MIYRRPKFLAVFDLAPPSSPPPPYPDSKLDRRNTGRNIKRGDLLTGELKGQGEEQERLVLYKSFITL